MDVFLWIGFSETVWSLGKVLTAQDKISFSKALDCRAGDRGLDSPGRTNTLSLKVTEK